MSRWILGTLLFSACLPRASVADAGHNICSAKVACPFFTCTCDDGGVSYRASRCVQSCSDEATTCTSVCSGAGAPDLGGEVLTWSATLSAGAGEFYGSSRGDRDALDRAAALCRKAAVPLGECATGNSALVLEGTGSAICTLQITLAATTYSYDGTKAFGLTEAKVLAINACLDLKEIPGPSCGLGQFACTGG